MRLAGVDHSVRGRQGGRRGVDHRARGPELMGASTAPEARAMEDKRYYNLPSLSSLTRFNKIAISNNKFQMASGQGSHWLIESPTIFSFMCSPPLSNICQFYF